MSLSVEDMTKNGRLESEHSNEALKRLILPLMLQRRCVAEDPSPLPSQISPALGALLQPPVLTEPDVAPRNLRWRILHPQLGLPKPANMPPSHMKSKILQGLTYPVKSPQLIRRRTAALPVTSPLIKLRLEFSGVNALGVQKFGKHPRKGSSPNFDVTISEGNIVMKHMLFEDGPVSPCHHQNLRKTNMVLSSGGSVLFALLVTEKSSLILPLLTSRCSTPLDWLCISELPLPLKPDVAMFFDQWRLLHDVPLEAPASDEPPKKGK